MLGILPLTFRIKYNLELHVTREVSKFEATEIVSALITLVKIQYFLLIRPDVLSVPKHVAEKRDVMEICCRCCLKFHTTGFGRKPNGP